MEKCYAKIHPARFGAACGIVWSASLFIMAMIASWSAYGRPFVQAVGSLYFSYGPGWIGGLIGAFWGFLDAFIGGFVIIYLYNCLLGKACCKPGSKTDL